MTDLGPEWVPDGDGVPHRQAARVVLFDADGRVLLLRGHDSHDLDHNWWFTVGGGKLDHESDMECALRELREETGIQLNEDDLEGPILYRESQFPFANVTARQDEHFFLAQLDRRDIKVNQARLTELEQEVLDEYRWFTPDELAEEAERSNVYPVHLPELVRNWVRGWDGICRLDVDGSLLESRR